MIGQWLVYALAVSLLLSAAAWLAERGGKAQRWPTRWVWLAAMAGSVGLPVWAWLAPPAPDAVPSVVAAPTALVLESIPRAAAAPVVDPGLAPETVALIGWAALSVLLLLAIVALAVRLHLRRRRWPRRTVDGVDVWVSRRTGPAALGLLRGHVVVPEWALELDEDRRRLLVRHEAEHVRARDPQLALVGLLLAVLVPWNLPLWWQLRRLRLAIEVDCDERVLRGAEDVQGYGSLLLEVCHRKAAITGALALAESRSMLERRIRMITQATRGPATFRAVGLAVVAGLVLAVACETPAPTGPADAGGNPLEIDGVREVMASESCTPIFFVDGARSSLEAVEAMDAREVESIEVAKGGAVQRMTGDADACGIVSILTEGATLEEQEATRRLAERIMAARRAEAGQEVPKAYDLQDVQDAPAFTPMTVRPQLKNAADVRAAFDDYYPPLLEDAGIGGTAEVWFLIDEDGNVARMLIEESTGYDALDAAALKVAGTMEFTPAYNRDVRVPVWVQLPITFEPEAGGDTVETGQEAAGDVDQTAARAGVGEVVAMPGDTPMTEGPRLRNSREVAELLMQHYPEALREAGIGGTVDVWFYINTEGEVERTLINASSGQDALDRAALMVADRLEFTPAMDGDEPVAVWIGLPVTFEVQR